MLIAGFQKSTLLDYPGKVACLLFTYGCNLRCEYCHNPELVVLPCRASSIVKEEKIFSFLKRRRNLLDAVVITGGEPTIQKDLTPFIKRVKEMDYLVKLDTNGINYKKVKEIMDLDIVDYWAMDVKYGPKVYEQQPKGMVDIQDIQRSIRLIMEKAKEYEFRTTYVKGIHTLESVEDIARLIVGAKRYYIQNFRPGKTINPSLNTSNSFTQEELKQMKKIAKKYIKSVYVR